MIGIYKITSPCLKVYIGQSINIENRFKSYQNPSNCKSQVKLYRSFLKYGVDKHVFEILELCEIEELNEKERYYQDLYSATGKSGLNLLLTSSYGMSGKHSQETILKMRISSIGKNVGNVRSFETRKKDSLVKKGIKASEDTKLKMSLVRKGKSILKGEKRKKRKPVTEETKLKLRKSLKNLFSREKHPLAKKVIDTNTGIIYNCAKDASEAYNVKYNSLNKYLNGKNKNKTTLQYL